MNESILFAVIFLWNAVIVYFLFKYVYNYLLRKVLISVFQKGFDAKNKSKEIFKYICEPIFSRPTTRFNTTESCITLELIHTEKSTKTKVATISLELRDSQISRTIDCRTDIRGFFLIHRHKALPPITHIRAVHNCSIDSKILFEGIEIHDQLNGQRFFHSVKSHIFNVEMNEAIVHMVRGQTLEFCSKETFCPDFHSLKIERYGEQIQNTEEFRGIRLLLPKLNWFEEFLFNAFLIHLSFAFMSGILFYLKESKDILRTMASILISGLLSPTVTQIISHSYRLAVKRLFNSKCSPMKMESNQFSQFWLVFRYLYLLSTFLITILISILAIILIDEDLKMKYKSMTESQILLIVFVFTLVVIYTIWIIMFAVIRYLLRRLFFKPKTIDGDMESADEKPSHDISGSVKSGNAKREANSHRSTKDKKDSAIELSDRSESLKIRSKSKSESKNNDEDSYSQIVRDNELNTGSVIVSPTKSLGYIDPKVFKLSDSKTDETKDKPKDNSKDNSDKKN